MDKGLSYKLTFQPIPSLNLYNLLKYEGYRVHK